MLKLNSKPKRSKRVDWFPDRTYLHFDSPINRANAEKLVRDQSRIWTHSFLPLIAFDKQVRKYRRAPSGGLQITLKVRRLAYCSNWDACIFAYYAAILSNHYEKLLIDLGLDTCVIGYRKVGSNIELALSAFAEIQSRGACVAFAFDISGFFDNIDHAVLKRNWRRVLDVDILPLDHYKVFKSLTSFSTVDRRACLRRLGDIPSARDREIGRQRLCSKVDYKTKIRGEGTSHSDLVTPWKRPYRIPQGTPLSALAANISMLDFDIRMQREVTALGGSYRRYSDDILLVVPSPARSKVTTLLQEALRHTTRRLKLNLDKTDIVEFIPSALAAGKGTRPLQYLGFLFDGEHHLIRSATISKFYRRMKQAVKAAHHQHSRALKGEIKGRGVIYRRKLNATHTYLGVKTFVTGYARSASRLMQEKKIQRQLASHHKTLNDLLRK